MSPYKVKGRAEISRRDTLKMCLVPVGAAFASHWVVGCSNDKTGNTGDETIAGSGGSAPSKSSGGNGASASHASSGSGGAAQNAGAGMQPNTGSGGAAASNSGSGGNAAQAMADAGGAVRFDAGSAAGSAVAGPNVAWAGGGTKSMQGGYPDPFDNPGAMCVVYPAQTIGPCYAQMPMTREDISDGLTGLPVRLSFLVVHSDGCTPVPNASIDVWHSGSNGIYSAYAMGTICNPGTDNVLSQMFCRGVQTSDENGRADFSSVFPGWYTGRTIHIHFTIRAGGQEYVTSQIYFQDALSDEILAQGEYAARGKRDTTNATDSLFSSGGATPEQVLFSTAKRPDGVLHAWKALSIG